MKHLRYLNKAEELLMGNKFGSNDQIIVQSYAYFKDLDKSYMTRIKNVVFGWENNEIGIRFITKIIVKSNKLNSQYFGSCKKAKCFYCLNISLQTWLTVSSFYISIYYFICHIIICVLFLLENIRKGGTYFHKAHTNLFFTVRLWSS